MFSVIYTVPVETAVNPTRNVRHFRGGTINITCSFTGLPIPTITWLKNNVELVYTDIISPVESVQFNDTWGIRQSVLVFTNLQLTDTADYHCVANNTGAPGNTFIVQSTISSIFVTRKHL